MQNTNLASGLSRSQNKGGNMSTYLILSIYDKNSLDIETGGQVDTTYHSEKLSSSNCINKSCRAISYNSPQTEPVV